MCQIFRQKLNIVVITRKGIKHARIIAVTKPKVVWENTLVNELTSTTLGAMKAPTLLD